MPNPTRRPADCPHNGRHLHGTVAAYRDDGCGCTPCRDAHSANMRRYRKQRVHRRWAKESIWLPSHVGVRRRLEALMALGWSLPTLAAKLGYSYAALEKLRTREGKVLRTIAQPIFDLYDELCMTVPEGPYALRSRRQAARKGWAPPLAWDDDDIDDPAARPHIGGRVRSGVVDDIAVDLGKPVTRAEMRASVARLVALGYTSHRAAEVLGVTRRQVDRIRRAIRAEQPEAA